MKETAREDVLVSFYFFALALIVLALAWFVPVVVNKPELLPALSSALFAAIGAAGAVLFFAFCRGYGFARPVADQALALFILLVLIELALSALNLSATKNAVDVERSRVNRGIVEKLIENIDEGGRGYHHITTSDLDSMSYLTGFEDKQVIFQEEGEGLIAFHTDENGYRNPIGLYPSASTFGAAVFGDSFAHGCCVPDDEVFARRFEALTGLRTYNLGYSGTGLLYSLAAYMEFAKQKSPKNIVVQILEGASYSRMSHELQIGKYDRYLEAARAGKTYAIGLAARDAASVAGKEETLWTSVFKSTLKRIYRLTEPKGEAKDSALDAFRAKLQSLKLFQLLGDIKRVVISTGKRPTTEKYPKCETFAEGHEMRKISTDILQYFRAEATRNGGKVILVFQPSFRFIVPDFPDCERRFFHEFAAASDGQVIFVDLVDQLKKTPDPFAYYYALLREGWPHAHFNGLGYDLAAKASAEALSAARP